MKHTYEEKIEYEVNRLRGNRDAQNQFFGVALGIQNSPKTYLKKYADDKMAFACHVLCRCAWCNGIQCDKCKLTSANNNAHKEIDSGLRKKLERNGYGEKTISMPGYWISTSVDRKTGAVTVTMRPFIKKEE